MPTLRSLVTTALLGLCLAATAVHAADAPSRESIQQSLDHISERKLADADQKALQEVLQGTLTQIANDENNQQQRVDLKQQLLDAPKDTIANQRELARLKATKVVPVEQRYASQSVTQLEQLLT